LRFSVSKLRRLDPWSDGDGKLIKTNQCYEVVAILLVTEVI